MDDSMFMSMLIGVGVIVLVGVAGLVMSGSFGKLAEQRLEGLTGRGSESEVAEQLAQRDPPAARRPSTSAPARSGPSSSPTPRT